MDRLARFVGGPFLYEKSVTITDSVPHDIGHQLSPFQAASMRCIWRLLPEETVNYHFHHLHHPAIAVLNLHDEKIILYKLGGSVKILIHIASCIACITVCPAGYMRLLPACCSHIAPLVMYILFQNYYSVN